MSAKQLIITADDFGLTDGVNQAIIEAHQQGILTAASLMVGAPRWQQAVALAKQNPTLRVGLHLTLVEGKPVLPAQQIPQLVDKTGQFSQRLVISGLRFFFLPAVRRQLAAEIRSQFVRFQQTGLPLDHVNAHNHMHFHPTVLGLILRIGSDYGLRALRWPYEPKYCLEPAHVSQRLARWGLAPWLALMAWRLRRAGICHNDYLLGLQDTGHITSQHLQHWLNHLPDGLTEIYCHPATVQCDQLKQTMADYQPVAEYQGLIDPAVQALIQRLAIESGGFSDFCR